MCSCETFLSPQKQLLPAEEDSKKTSHYSAKKPLLSVFCGLHEEEDPLNNNNNKNKNKNKNIRATNNNNNNNKRGEKKKRHHHHENGSDDGNAQKTLFFVFVVVLLFFPSAPSSLPSVSIILDTILIS